MYRLAIVLFLAGCAHRRVDIAVLGAAVGPQDWDGMGTSGAAVSSVAVSALSTYNPFLGAVSATVVDSLVEGYAPPDVTGTVTLHSDDPSLHGAVLPLAQVDNSFTPRWEYRPFTNVPLGPSTGLAVRLEDYDPLNANDLVAEVFVPVAWLRRALRTGEPLRVDFVEPTQSKLVWLAVDVRPAAAR